MKEWNEMTMEERTAMLAEIWDIVDYDTVRYVDVKTIAMVAEIWDIEDDRTPISESDWNEQMIAEECK